MGLAELIIECEKRGLKTSGSAEILLARLEGYNIGYAAGIKSNHTSTSGSTSSGSNQVDIGSLGGVYSSSNSLQSRKFTDTSEADASSDESSSFSISTTERKDSSVESSSSPSRIDAAPRKTSLFGFRKPSGTPISSSASSPVLTAKSKGGSGEKKTKKGTKPTKSNNEEGRGSAERAKSGAVPSLSLGPSRSFTGAHPPSSPSHRNAAPPAISSTPEGSPRQMEYEKVVKKLNMLNALRADGRVSEKEFQEQRRFIHETFMQAQSRSQPQSETAKLISEGLAGVVSKELEEASWKINDGQFEEAFNIYKSLLPHEGKVSPQQEWEILHGYHRCAVKLNRNVGNHKRLLELSEFIRGPDSKEHVELSELVSRLDEELLDHAVGVLSSGNTRTAVELLKSLLSTGAMQDQQRLDACECLMSAYKLLNEHGASMRVAQEVLLLNGRIFGERSPQYASALRTLVELGENAPEISSGKPIGASNTAPNLRPPTDSSSGSVSPLPITPVADGDSPLSSPDASSRRRSWDAEGTAGFLSFLDPSIAPPASVVEEASKVFVVPVNALCFGHVKKKGGPKNPGFHPCFLVLLPDRFDFHKLERNGSAKITPEGSIPLIASSLEGVTASEFTISTTGKVTHCFQEVSGDLSASEWVSKIKQAIWSLLSTLAQQPTHNIDTIFRK